MERRKLIPLHVLWCACQTCANTFAASFDIMRPAATVSYRTETAAAMKLGHPVWWSGGSTQVSQLGSSKQSAGVLSGPRVLKGAGDGAQSRLPDDTEDVISFSPS